MLLLTFQNFLILTKVVSLYEKNYMQIVSCVRGTLYHYSESVSLELVCMCVCR